MGLRVKADCDVFVGWLGSFEVDVGGGDVIHAALRWSRIWSRCHWPESCSWRANNNTVEVRLQQIYWLILIGKLSYVAFKIRRKCQQGWIKLTHPLNWQNCLRYIEILAKVEFLLNSRLRSSCTNDFWKVFVGLDNLYLLRWIKTILLAPQVFSE